MGGRGGEMSERLNQPAWLLDACKVHHRYVTSPVGAALAEAKSSGWLLEEWRDGLPQDARLVPVLTRYGLVLLDNDGGWTPVAA